MVIALFSDVAVNRVVRGRQPGRGDVETLDIWPNVVGEIGVDVRDDLLDGSRDVDLGRASRDVDLRSHVDDGVRHSLAFSIRGVQGVCLLEQRLAAENGLFQLNLAMCRVSQSDIWCLLWGTYVGKADVEQHARKGSQGHDQTQVGSQHLCLGSDRF